MSFADRAKSGGSYKCIVTQNVGGAATQGTTYISGGMVRSETNTKVAGMSINASAIIRGGYSYTWTSAAPTTGFKAKVSTGADTSGGSTSGQYSYNGAQIGDYNCEPWATDLNMFVVPANIAFTDTTAK